VREPILSKGSRQSVERLDEGLTRPITDVIHYEDHHRRDLEKQSTSGPATVPVYVSIIKHLASWLI
jgi:hypothetical protein